MASFQIRMKPWGIFKMCIISSIQVVSSYWGAKGATAVLFLITYRYPPYSFPYKPRHMWWFLADCIIQTCKSMRVVWEDEGGFLGTAVFLLSMQLQAIQMVVEELLPVVQLVTMLLKIQKLF